QFRCLAPAAAACLSEFKRLFQETVRSLLSIADRGRREARDHPFSNSPLKLHAVAPVKFEAHLVMKRVQKIVFSVRQSFHSLDVASGRLTRKEAISTGTYCWVFSFTHSAASLFLPGLLSNNSRRNLPV